MRRRSFSTTGLSTSATTAATANTSNTGPDARARAHTPSRASGSVTSWIQRGTTNGSGARGGSLGGASWLTQPSSPLRQYAQRMRLLFVGDVVGGIGRRTLAALLPTLREELAPDFVVVNGENAAGGLGITPRTADELFALGVDVLTLGNHTYRHREVYPYLDDTANIVRPANFLRSQPGHGTCVVERDGTRLGVLNLSGNVHLRAGRNAFAEADAALHILREDAEYVLVDMHAEVTSEKVAMGWHLDGRVTAVVGTHTHVPTADDRVLPGGTAYVTDVGMTGPRGGGIGVKREQAVERFLSLTNVRFETSDDDPWLNALLVEAGDDGRATGVEQLIMPAPDV